MLAELAAQGSNQTPTQLPTLIESRQKKISLIKHPQHRMGAQHIMPALVAKRIDHLNLTHTVRRACQTIRRPLDEPNPRLGGIENLYVVRTAGSWFITSDSATGHVRCS